MNLWLFNNLRDKDMLWKLLDWWLLFLGVAILIYLLTIIFGSLLIFFSCIEERVGNSLILLKNFVNHKLMLSCGMQELDFLNGV